MPRNVRKLADSAQLMRIADLETQLSQTEIDAIRAAIHLTDSIAYGQADVYIKRLTKRIRELKYAKADESENSLVIQDMLASMSNIRRKLGRGIKGEDI